MLVILLLYPLLSFYKKQEYSKPVHINMKGGKCRAFTIVRILKNVKRTGVIQVNKVCKKGNHSGMAWASICFVVLPK